MNLFPCRGIFREQGTLERSIDRVIDVLRIESLPAFGPGFCYYIELTDFAGKFRGTVRIRHSDNEESHWDAAVEIEMPDPLRMYQVIGFMGPLVFDRDGTY